MLQSEEVGSGTINGQGVRVFCSAFIAWVSDNNISYETEPFP